MWLNSDDASYAWLEDVDTVQSNGSVFIEDNLQKRAAENNECLGLIIRKYEVNNNLTAEITSWDCNRKMSFVCSLDPTQFTNPTNRVKFPCLPRRQVGRVKRTSDEEGNKSNRQDVLSFELNISKYTPKLCLICLFIYSFICV